MKKQRILWNAILLSAISLIAAQVFAQAEISQSEWEAQQTRNQLMDQEKFLYQEHDNLRRDIDDLTAQVEVRMRKIAAAQARLARVRHELITVKMKLMP